MKTSIIILTYNQLGVTKECIDSIYRHTHQDNMELIIIDNGSTDGTVEYLENISNIKTIFNTTNLGFAVGCNQGLKISTGDNILFLNNDTLVTENWLNNMLSLLYSTEKIGMVGPVSNYVSGPQQIHVSYHHLSELDAFAENYCKIHSREHQRVFRLVGFCLLVKKEVIHAIGGFDERFKMGSFEDDDLCLRALLHGYELHIAMDSFIHHIGHSTFTGNQEIDISALYRENYQKFKSKWNIDLTYFTYPRYDIVNLIREDDKKILDIGCGAGATGLALINRRDCELHGVETHPIAASIAQNHYKQVHGADIEQFQLPYPKNYFDVIIFADVLEHLKEPQKVILRIAPYLRPGGTLVCSIPNIMHAEALLPLLMGYWNYVSAGILDRTHLRFFTPLTVHTLFPPDIFQITHRSYNYIAIEEKVSDFFNEVSMIANKYNFSMHLLPEYTKIYQMLMVVEKKQNTTEE
ncbi:MAG: glycosyltransferase [Eubacteriales bacterium]